jgi:hypothetical protein
MIHSLYYSVYAEETAIDNPEKFTFDYAEFLEKFGLGHKS